MNTERLKLIMVEGGKTNKWGAKLADGPNFYRQLFKYEKLPKLTEEHVCNMFASYCNWLTQIENMIADCRSGGTEEDDKAVRYAEVLQNDILEHIHHIMMNVQSEPEDMVDKLNQYADEVLARKASQ